LPGDVPSGHLAALDTLIGIRRNRWSPRFESVFASATRLLFQRRPDGFDLILRRDGGTVRRDAVNGVADARLTSQKRNEGTDSGHGTAMRVATFGHERRSSGSKKNRRQRG